MTTQTPSIAAAHTEEIPLEVLIAGACSHELANVTPADILKRLQSEVPELELRYATARSGWYRLGGIVVSNHRRIAKNIETWAEEVSDGDLDRLMDRCGEIRGFATKFEGRATHIFLQWFVTEQIEEEATVSDIIARMRLVGERGEGLYLIDRELSDLALRIGQSAAAG